MEPSDSPRRPREAPSSGKMLLFAILVTVFIGLGFIALAAGIFFSGQKTSNSAAAEDNPTDAEPVHIAMVRLVGGRATWPYYVSVLEQMGESLDRPVEAMFLYGVEEVDNIFENYEDVEGAFMSTCAYLRAREKDPGMTRIVVPVINGKALEQAVLVVRADSPYHELDDLAGTRAILMGTSLAGNAYPRWLLEQHEKGTAEEFFGVVEVRDSQEENLRRVADGRADVTAANRSQLASWPGETFRVIAHTEEYGMPPFVVSSQLSDAEAETLIRALLAYEARPEHGVESILDGFVRGDPSDYDLARELMDCMTIEPADTGGEVDE